MDPTVDPGANGNGNGNGNAPMLPAYAEQVPAELRSPDLAGYMSKYQDAPSFYKALENAVKYQGKSVAIPGTDPKEIETWKKEHLPKLQHVFADRLPPDSPDAYEFKLEGVTDEALKSDEILSEYRKFAHGLGLTKDQAAKQVEFLAQVLPKIVPKAPEMNFVKDEKVDELMAEVFKSDSVKVIDNYKKTIDLLSTEIPELKDFLMDGAALYGPKADNRALSNGDHPTMVKLINVIARMTQPDSSPNLNGGMNLSQNAQALIDEAKDIQQNPENPKYKQYWASDKYTVDYVNSLYARAYPGETTI